MPCELRRRVNEKFACKLGARNSLIECNFLAQIVSFPSDKFARQIQRERERERNSSTGAQIWRLAENWRVAGANFDPEELAWWPNGEIGQEEEEEEEESELSVGLSGAHTKFNHWRAPESSGLLLLSRREEEEEEEEEGGR